MKKRMSMQIAVDSPKHKTPLQPLSLTSKFDAERRNYLSNRRTKAFKSSQTNALNKSVQQNRDLINQLVTKVPSFRSKFKKTFNQDLNNKSEMNSAKKYYYSDLVKSLKSTNIHNYVINLYKMHFQQCLHALKLSGLLRFEPRSSNILSKHCTHDKTIILDLDETLVHCSDHIGRSSVKLSVPTDNGTIVMASINIRPFCKEFLRQLSEFSEVIIFTASHSTYADAVCDYLDPEKKLISHRLYRQHCTFQKGIYIKDLRTINRKIENTAIVDNSLFSYCLQLENGIPILPFYDNEKDRELLTLLSYLRQLVQQEDIRQKNKEYFRIDLFKNGVDVKNHLIKSQ